jgi:hypothetical protein
MTAPPSLQRQAPATGAGSWNFCRYCAHATTTSGQLCYTNFGIKGPCRDQIRGSSFQLSELQRALPDRQVEAGPETVDLEVVCRICGAPFRGREDGFVLKYFLLRKAARVDPRVRRISQRARPKNSQ